MYLQICCRTPENPCISLQYDVEKGEGRRKSKFLTTSQACKWADQVITMPISYYEAIHV